MKNILCLFLILHFAIAKAQFRYKFNHYTSDDGLPTNTIYSITQDYNGNIILGTDNGLTIFDGNDFKNFNVKDGLSNPYIVAVTKDENQTIWLVNYNGKLQKFVNNKIVNTPIFSKQANDIIVTKNKIYLYNSQNRYANKTYYYQEINKNNYRNYTPKNNNNIPNKVAPPILYQENSEIKVENNFLVYNDQKVLLPSEISLIHKVFFKKNKVYILDENYLFIVAIDGKIIQKTKLPKPISENCIYKYDFIIDQNNNCWLNLQNQGLYILKNNSWTAINQDLGLNSTDNINFLFCDFKSKIWIATNEKGLFCIKNTTTTYYLFPNENNYFNGFANSLDEKSLFVSSKFCLYAYKNEILVLIKKSDTEIKIENYNNIPVLYTPLKTKPYWDKKLQLLTVQGRQFLQYDSQNNFILNGTNGISNYKNNQQIQITSNLKEKIKNVVFYKNEYYFNNSEKINIRTFDKKKFVVKRELQFKIKGYIQDFVFDNDTMYVAANNLIYEIFNEKITDSITQVNHVKLEFINKLKVINNDLFVCAENGLFRLSKKGNKVINKYNFLPNNEVYNVAVFGTELLVATKNGLAKIQKNELSQKSEIPKLQFFYKEYKSNISKPILSKIEVSTLQKQIEIQVQIQNFNSKKNQHLDYRIDKSDWINYQNKSLVLENLEFGKNELFFRVKDVNSDWNFKKIEIYRAYPFFMKWWFVLGVFAFVYWIILQFLNYNKSKLNLINKKKIETNNRIVELRQNALSAMMNPHFIFNSLNAIQYFVNSNQKEKSSEHLAKLSRLVRLFLSQAAAPFINLEDEINRLKLYVELEQVRFENFQFEINIDPNIDPKITYIPNMIVQPFIENAILHGVSHLSEKMGEINLNFSLNQNVLTIEIVDNGMGINEKKSQNDTHISKGIAIISERLQILQESYPQNVYSIYQEIAFPNELCKGHKVTIKYSLFK